MHIILPVIKWIIITLVLLGVGIYLFVQFHPVFGGKPDEQSLARMQNSPAFDGEKFNNLELTVKLNSEEDSSLLKWAWGVINPPKGKNPSDPIPSEPLDKTILTNNDMVWFGHSTVLFKIANKVFITDPVFYRASPVPFAGEPFKMTHTPTISELPNIDAVLISHDHYDHLDYKTIQEIDSKTKLFIVPLGVKGHLQRWGVADEKIIELDWDEQTHIEDVVFTLVPARHFSGRRLNQENPTLWGGML